MGTALKGAAAAGCLLFAPLADAFDLSVDALDLEGTLSAQVSIGATMRTEERDPNLVGKLNLPGQEQFCDDALIPALAAGIDCTTVEGNAAYLALPGSASVNADNGNLNYDKGDIVNAAVRFAPRLQLTHEHFGIDIGALAFYDPVNDQLDDYHPSNSQDNNGFQPRHTRRSKAVRGAIGSGVVLLDAYVTTQLPLPGDRELSIKAGNQLLSIGTSTLLVLNSLNTVNPPDTNRLFVPGADVRDVFQRVPLLTLGVSLNDSVSAMGFYQFAWRPAEIPAMGTYYSTNDAASIGGYYNMLLFGKVREDPNNLAGPAGRTPGNAELLSNAGRTLFRTDTVDARDSGQFGLGLSYLASWLNNTSFDLAYLRLHSRLPLGSFYAAEKGCSHDSTTSAQALIDCRGFATTPLGVEPLPLDTVRYYLEYPEDIDTFGFSFATSLGEVAWTGEIVYRPNQPLQVDPTDVGFAALQPIFPAQTLEFGITAIPGRRVAVPDYIETIYRGNDNVLPGQVIHGFERFETLNYNTSFLLLSGASENPFGADQVTTLLEVGAYQVIDLPSLDQLQLAAPGVQYHHSAGVDDTGPINPDQAAADPARRLNPTYQAGGFATDFSWGYRLLMGLSYEDVLPRTRLIPQFTFFHDMNGRAPLPSAEFVQGRRQASAGLSVAYGDSLTANVRYTWFMGGGIANLLSDRDNVQLNLSYDF
ncbi:MAG TPA: DUF1302 family protein [Fontimonas sp.]